MLYSKVIMTYTLPVQAIGPHELTFRQGKRVATVILQLATKA